MPTTSFLKKIKRSRPVSAALEAGKNTLSQAPKNPSSVSDIIARMAKGFMSCGLPPADDRCAG
jgi:hypothetical protein